MPSFAYSHRGTITDRVYDGIFHITDWFPTILAMAGMSEKLTEMDLDGVNQLSILKAKYARRQPRKQMIYGMIGRVKNLKKAG